MSKPSNNIAPVGAPAMDGVECLAICAIAIALTSFNGQPYWMGSGVSTLGGTICLVLYNIIRRGGVFHIPPGARPVLLMWGLWFTTASLSLAANPGAEQFDQWIWGFVEPFAMLVVLVGLRPSPAQTRMIVVSLALGWLLRFGYAALVFNRGTPLRNLDDLLLAHYDYYRIAPYMFNTYGNTSRTAILVSVAVVLLTLALMTLRRLSLIQKGILAGALGVVVVNGLITGSRGFFLISALALMFAAMKAGRRAGVFLLCGLALAGLVFIRNTGFVILSRFSAVLETNLAVDASLQGRWESMKIGVEQMFSGPFGVGLAQSYKTNAYTVAHQFAIFQGSESGVLAFLATTGLFVVLGMKALTIRYNRDSAESFLFLFAAFAWMLFAMTTNTAISTGPNIPWIGLLAICVAMTEMTAPLQRVREVTMEEALALPTAVDGAVAGRAAL